MRPNAATTPPTASASAAATRRARRILRATSRASRGSRSSIQPSEPAARPPSTPRPIANGSRSRRPTAGTQISISATSVNTYIVLDTVRRITTSMFLR